MKTKTKSEKPLSSRQREVFCYCREYFAANLQFPTLRQIAAKFTTFPFAVSGFLAQLERRGLIERNEGGGWRIVGATVTLPSLPEQNI